MFESLKWILRGRKEKEEARRLVVEELRALRQLVSKEEAQHRIVEELQGLRQLVSKERGEARYLVVEELQGLRQLVSKEEEARSLIVEELQGLGQLVSKEKEEAQRLIIEELQGLRKLARKQSAMIEEMRREQETLVAQRSRNEPLIELCDSIFYLLRAFQGPGLMSRQHAQALNMVLHRMQRFTASLGFEMIMEEGMPFNPEAHEAVANRNPGSLSLEIVEVVSPGYLQDGKIVRPAKVIVGEADETSSLHSQESVLS